MQKLYKYAEKSYSGFIPHSQNNDWVLWPLKIPEGAELLSVHRQNKSICIWASVDPSKPLIEIPITVVATGLEVPWRDEYQFLETLLSEDEATVLHLFLPRVLVEKKIITLA